ncbi:hypothetical protein EDB80DRAFT_534713, partial [Ilyonectria destructans]
KLPIEIISLLCELLHINELFDLGQTCRDLSYILRDESICRTALQVSGAKLPLFLPEAVEAKALDAHARGLRRLVEKWSAVRCGESYLVATVAMVQSYIYTNGVLCYVALKPKYLQILDVHQSAEKELVVKIPEML